MDGILALQISHGIGYDTAFLLRSEYKLDSFYRFHFLAAEFSVASGNDNHGIRRNPMALPDYVPALVVRVLGNGTGVDEINVSLLVPGDNLKSMGDEPPLVGGGLRKVELASECEKGDCHLIVVKYLSCQN